MARFKEELPNDLIKDLEKLGNECEKMMGEMTQAGAEVAYKLIKSNMSGAFKSTKSLEQGLKITKAYKTKDDGINTFVGFYGYVKGSKPTRRHPKGTPIPLIAMAREYGTSRGEAKKPFLRKSFKKKDIEQAMLKVQDKYIGD